MEREETRSLEGLERRRLTEQRIDLAWRKLGGESGSQVTRRQIGQLLAAFLGAVKVELRSPLTGDHMKEHLRAAGAHLIRAKRITTEPGRNEASDFLDNLGMWRLATGINFGHPNSVLDPREEARRSSALGQTQRLLQYPIRPQL